MNLNYHPSFFDKRYLRSWWLIPVFMLAGAIIGFLFGSILPPTYEAVFTLTTNFEIDPTEEITELMLDGAINHVGELVYNPEVINAVLLQETDKGNEISIERLKEITTVERKLTSTFIKVRWHDPQVATRIANNWGTALFSRLQAAYEQSLLADSLSDYQDSLETCILETDESYTANPCFGMDPDQLEESIDDLSTKISQAREFSLGLHPYLYVNQYVEAETPTRPLYYSKSTLVLAGAAIGLIIAVLLIEVKNALSPKNAK